MSFSGIFLRGRLRGAGVEYILILGLIAAPVTGWAITRAISLAPGPDSFAKLFAAGHGAEANAAPSGRSAHRAHHHAHLSRGGSRPFSPTFDEQSWDHLSGVHDRAGEDRPTVSQADSGPPDSEPSAPS